MAAPDLIPFRNAQDLQDRAKMPEYSGPFRVMRGDTVGNPFTIVDGVSEEFAKSVVAFFEKSTHHQGYWITNPDFTPS